MQEFENQQEYMPQAEPVLQSPAPEPVQPVIPEPVQPVTPEPVKAVTPEPVQPAAQEPPVYQYASYEQAPRFVPDPPKKKKGGRVVGIIALCLCCSLLGGIAGGVIYHFMAPNQTVESSDQVDDSKKEQSDSKGNNTVSMQQGDRDTTVIDPEKIDTDKLLTPAEVYARYVNSTVGITTSVVTTNYFGYQSTSAASGSGFILTKDGYVLTNYHVIEDSQSITVSMYDGTEYAAQLIGHDESNDIAVLKIDAKDLAPVVLGNSDNMNVGDSVIAIGNPLGELTFSLTSGAVSALNRDVTMSNGLMMTLIQTDCAINSGNSGGALFNLYGEVIGITNAKYSSSSMSSASIDNIGFAIPINDVRDIIESIIEVGYVAKPFIGVSVVDVSEESQRYGLPNGAAVAEVVKDGPCDEAGLEVNDIITHMDGKEVTGSSDLVKKVGDLEIGQTVELTVYRKGKTLTLSLTVVEKSQTTQQQETTQPQYPNFGN